MSSWTALGAGAVLVGLASPVRAEVRVLESDAQHVLVEIVPEAPTVERLTGPSGDYVRLRMLGAGMTEETGRPEVPRGSFQVALPPNAAPHLRVVRQQWSGSQAGAVTPLPERIGVRDPFGPDQVLERDPVESVAYRAAGSYPAQPFGISEVRDLRGLRTANVIWHGVIAETGQRTHRILKSAVLEVTFTADPLRAGGGVMRPARADALWERTRSWPVINAPQARSWARGTIGDASSVGDRPWGGGTQVKVRVADTGMIKLTYGALSAAGFPPGVPTANVSVYQRSFDIDSVDAASVPAADLFVAIPAPVVVRDDGNGVFDGSDSILLYARSFRDQWMTSGFEHEDRFQTDNFYWVRDDPAGGARMAVRPPQPASAVADSLVSTPSVVFREEDLKYANKAPPDQGPGADVFETEFFFWNNFSTLTGGGQGWTFNDAFDTPDPVPGVDAALVVRALGGGRPLLTNFNNILDFTVNGTAVGTTAFYNGSLYAGQTVPPSKVLWPHTIPAGTLAGANTFSFRGRSYKGSSTTTPDGATKFFFDWYEVTYVRQLRASNGALLLSTESGTGADQRIRVRSFGGTDIRLFDLTDPANPENVAVDANDPAQVAPAGGVFDLRFGHDNAGGTNHAAYLAIRESRVPVVGAADLEAISPPTLLAGGAGARWVAVAHDDFVSGAQVLANYRSRRYTAIVAPVSQVWDVFGMGGRDPRAIKAYAAYAYHRWAEPVAFLTLIGDASEDHRGLSRSADPDYVPSHSLFASYEGNPEESDQYYAEVTRAAPGAPWDDLADIYVGRLAVGSLEELAWNVERMVKYESEDQDGTWRRRAVFLADDAISGSLGGGFGEPYGYRSGETLFCDYSTAYAESLAAQPFDSLRPELLCMSQWNHPCARECYDCGRQDGTCGDPTPNTCDPDTIDCETRLGVDCGIWYECRTTDTCADGEWAAEHTCVRNRMKQVALPVLRDALSEGELIWNFQGHANRFFLTHEEIWYDAPFGARHDVQNLTNYGKPFIFLGFACHLAEFDKFDEGTNEDCLSEKMMNVRQFNAQVPGGCVASFSSSGFEFLTPNLAFNQHVLDAFFFPERAANPGNVAGGGATLPDLGPDSVYRWTLGESTTRARLMHQNDWPSTGQTRQAAQRFILLGDPALEPNIGAPLLDVKVNGLPVEDPGETFFLDPAAEASVEIAVTATDGRGIRTWTVTDSDQGEIAAADYQIEDTAGGGRTTSAGVPIEQTLRYTFSPRDSDYTVSVEAADGSGFVGRFDLSFTTAFEFTGGEPAVYPSPFQDETWFVYRLTGQAQEIDVGIYTVSGRRIRDLHAGIQPSNTQLRVRWDGRDDNGQDVANGTYFFRLRATDGEQSVDRVIPVVKMR